MDENGRSYISLPRGGVLIPTTKGNIQFGIPPETIKDTMLREGGVPNVFIVPQFMFDVTRRISLADIEFPVYYNFFIKKEKARIICNEDQRKRLEAVMTEALFGPRELDIDDEFVDGESTPGFPDLKAEMTNFRRTPMAAKGILELDDVVVFSVFDSSGTVRFDNIKIQFGVNRALKILEDGRGIATIDRKVPLFSEKLDSLETRLVFKPPIFGITTLGAGHGFDPNASTSGLIIWINRRGIIVDPPVNSTENLLQLGVSPKLIDKLILTHCHADHDAGTLQKILQEGRVNIYTTKTIFHSFIKKSVALTGIPQKQILKFVSFFPVQIGKPMTIGGGKFTFNYTLHSIPTISIQASLHGKSMIYSSDTMNEPEYINNLYDQGLISKNRRDFLIDFPWNHDVIFHEAGIPPIHTSLTYLCSLAPNIQDRMYLVHVSQNQVPTDCNLRIAPTGLLNTIELDVDPLPYGDAIDMLDAIHHVDLFENVSFEKAREFLLAAKVHSLSAGQVLFRKGDRGDHFYIVISGEIDIILDGKIITTYGIGGYFGEKSLFVDENRTATAIANTEAKVMAVQKEDMLSLIRGTRSEELLRQIAIFQNFELRDRLSNNPFFRQLTATQQTRLHGLMKPEPRIYEAREAIAEKHGTGGRCHVIRDGIVDIYLGNDLIRTLGKGEFFGLKTALDPMAVSSFVYVAREQVSLYSIDQADLQNYLFKNPGVYIKLLHYGY